MNDIIKESAEAFILFFAAELESNLDDIIKERLPWKTTAEERQQICQSIAKHWLKQKGE